MAAEDGSLHIRDNHHNREAILSAASADVMTGWTSKSTRSLQFAIHSSSNLRSSAYIT